MLFNIRIVNTSNNSLFIHNLQFVLLPLLVDFLPLKHYVFFPFPSILCEEMLRLMEILISKSGLFTASYAH